MDATLRLFVSSFLDPLFPPFSLSTSQILILLFCSLLLVVLFSLLHQGSLDRIVRLWDANTGYFLERYEGHTDSVYSVAFSPDGPFFSPFLFFSFALQQRLCLSVFATVEADATTTTGKSLASGSLDKTLRLWDLNGNRARSRCRTTFAGHSDFVLSVTFSPDGNWLISGSKDRSVQFWDPRSAVTHMKLEGHKNSGLISF